MEDLKIEVSKTEKRLDKNYLEIARVGNYKNRLSYNTNAKIALPIAEGLTFIKISEILYCKASGNYTEIFLTGNKKYLVSRQLKEYEELLNDFNFFRIHHSYLIHLNYIKSYIKGEGGYVIMDDDAVLDVSRRRKEAFLNSLRHVF